MKGKHKLSKPRRQPQPREDNSRKSIRKQKRLTKKANRHQHYTKTGPKIGVKVEVGRFVKRPVDVEEHEVTTSKKKKQKPISSVQDLASVERERELKMEKKLQKEMEEKRRNMLLQANEDEDKLIKKLEKQLGMTKSKNKKNFFSNDGLDYLLEVCDRSTQEQLVAAQKHLANVDAESDFEDDLAVVTGKVVDKDRKKETNSEDNSEDCDSFSNHSEDEMSGFDEEEECDDGEEAESEDEEIDHQITNARKKEYDKLSKQAKEISHNKSTQDYDSDFSSNNKNTKAKRKESIKSSKHNGDKHKSNKTTENSDSDFNSDNDIFDSDCDDDMLCDRSEAEEEILDDSGDHIDKKVKNDGKSDVWEDIYGRKRDKEGNVIKEEKGAYIPPHLRNNESSSQSKEMIQLKRQIKGVLNKLAGTNLHWACTTVEALYNNNSRHSVNTALSDLWTEAVVQAAVTPDRMLAEHAALVSILQANVATQVGAHFLQELAKKFDAMTSESAPSEGKHLENLTAAFAFLYSFKICSASLVYSLLSRLLDTTQDSERRVSCMLGVLRAAGGALRKDDPAALKTFIHDTQAKLTKMSTEATAGSRMKYLLEVLMAVKNNNLTKIPNYDPTYSEHLKKMTKGIVRRGNYITPLNVCLDDLLKADTCGKWWVVGSAWEGSEAKEKSEEGEKKPSTHGADQKLLDLARKQRMNTDVRRSIFCIIMGAQDYMDAFEKLQQLGLKNQQEREIVHVLLACCLQEKTYNPYYAVLANKLCDYDRKFQLSIQYAVWDKIKDLENTSKVHTTNLAQFLIHLIMEKGLALSVLKVIEFSDLNKSTVRFMRQILLAIIMNENLQSSLEVFQRISAAPKLHMFRESLRLFIQHFLIRNAGKKQNVLSEEEMATLKERTQQVEKILSMHDSKLRL